MPLIDDFKTRFPQFDIAAIDASWPGIEPAYKCYYGVEYDGATGCDTEIILNLCAHLFVMQSSGKNAPAQALAIKSVGSVSTSYQTGETTNQRAFFMSTKYGQMFLQMTSARACGGYFV